jgi:hypothetical protein
MGRPSFVRRFDSIDDVAQQHKNRKILSFRELLIANFFSLVGVALMLAMSSRDHDVRRSLKSPASLVETGLNTTRLS